MWLCADKLKNIGFRQFSRWYWQCDTRFGLPADAHLSIFVGCEPRCGHEVIRMVEVSAFHVTFRVGTDHLHFYYHELDEMTWEPGGHTTAGEIARYGIEAHHLRNQADEIAAQVLAALNRRFLPRVEQQDLPT